jgi:nicotinamidase-related amidase
MVYAVLPDSGVYQLVLFLHILTAIVGFGSTFVWPMLSAKARKSGDPGLMLKVSEMIDEAGHVLSSPFIWASGVRYSPRMPAPPLAELVDPARTAVVTSEVQNGVVGEPSALPALAEAARTHGRPPRRAVRRGQAAGVPVIHATAARRADGRRVQHQRPAVPAVRRSPVALLPGICPAAEVVPELGPEPEDLVLSRLHGLNPMAGTDLDPILRNLGVTTIVVTGVSVNVAVTNLVMDAVNLGYQVVLPRDAVCGIPADYADAVIDNTLALLATSPRSTTWWRPGPRPRRRTS